MLKLTIKPGEFIDIGKRRPCRYIPAVPADNIHLLRRCSDGKLILYEAKYWRKNNAANDGENSAFHIAHTTLNQISHPKKHSA